MDCRLEGLIMRASVIPGVDYKEISQIISEDIDACKCKEYIYRDVYKYVFNGHLHADECEEWITALNEKDRSGKIWSIDETNNVAKKLDYDFDKKPYTKDEFRVAMHLVYYKNYFPLKESSVTLDSTTYGRMADFHFTSNNSKPCKLVDEFFDVMCK